MRTRTISAIACAVLVVPGALAAGRARAQDQTTKSVFVSVVDASGKPVTDLQPSEVAIGEDSLRLLVTGFKPSTTPLSIALLVDTTSSVVQYVQDFRRSTVAFVRRVHKASPDSEIMVMEFGQAASPLTRFTTNTLDLVKPLERLYPKQEPASVLMEAMGESSKMLDMRSNLRRAIVILNLEPTNEQSVRRPNQIVDDLKKSGASVWAVSLQHAGFQNAARDVVLPVLAQNTGGLREYIVASSAIEQKLVQIADLLLAQYELTYVRSPAAETPKVMQVRVGRPGLTIRAPSWPPR